MLMRRFCFGLSFTKIPIVYIPRVKKIKEKIFKVSLIKEEDTSVLQFPVRLYIPSIFLSKEKNVKEMNMAKISLSLSHLFEIPHLNNN